ncbi:hypothetical protein AMJ39_07150 [candidate division TA06 bacterium DG_24]|uniref:FecR protein domain-containing protein n=3 Tax=Bacteria division TA06 TaxID=1156500 RepID=A0A0S8JPQ0_UNCT6|nr:MAG: hypothetical protein AMJ39_07150 [candidate division TA06 bacterium DG_24]KPK67183.1 MAG: hypothetical protein AMJ82_11110 [candidate division TA06 bacterium SM23_40]KPL10757.1 MAG: hypothetical protein AMJ71_02110 [candidate division TA06 bacterium SM1_40]
MKRMRRCTVACMVLFLVLSEPFAALAVAQEATEQTAATISFLVGNVRVKRARAFRSVKAELDMELRVGDIIRTFSGARAEIQLEGGDYLRLKENSRLEITKLERRGNHRHRGFRTWVGSVLARVGRLTTRESTFEMSSPTMVAAVRGTTFSTTVGADETTELAVLDGTMGVINPEVPGPEVMVEEKQKTTVRRGVPPAVPIALTAAEIAALTAWAQAVWQVGAAAGTGAGTGAGAGAGVAPTTAAEAAATTPWYLSAPVLAGAVGVGAAVTTAVIIAGQGEEPGKATVRITVQW